MLSHKIKTAPTVYAFPDSYDFVDLKQAKSYNYIKQQGTVMGGKAKSIYLTILPRGSHVSVFKKMFFEAKSYNEYVKSEEFKAKWPSDKFDIVKEVY